MTTSYPDVTLTASWQDITALTGYSAIANARTLFQTKGGYIAFIYFGGASAPGANDGHQMNPGQSYTATAAHVWVRGTGSIALTVED